MTLLIRADASANIGTGHVMRCLALAQAWQDGAGKAVCAMAETTPAIDARLKSERCEIVHIKTDSGTENDASQTTALAKHFGAKCVAVDGYQFSAEYQRALKDAGCKILFLDDYGHALHYYADIVLNQNVSVLEAMYEARESYTRLLLGTRYCLLRREFAPWQRWERKIAPRAQKVLVTMGGSDVGNVTSRAMKAIASLKLKDLETTVVIGGSSPNFESPNFESAKSAAVNAGSKIKIIRDVSNLAALMAESDVAISAAGSTCWELCQLGLPSILIDVAKNQTAVAREMHARGCAIHAGSGDISTRQIAEQLERLLSSLDLRESLSRGSRELVDGKGAGRVASVLLGSECFRAESLRLRRVKSDDSCLLWKWANDPDVRAASFVCDPIPWQTHASWFDNKVAKEECVIFIAEDQEANPCGQIRFESRPDGGWEIDVSLAKNKRGCGLAAGLIESGVRTMRRERNGNARFHAFVRLENQASLRAFQKAGFEQIGQEKVAGNSAIHFLYQK
jgi:UDP-2,4-diacetamido-2,4,6-trideoxy-beta-L-altropyranose hydrolase